MQPRNNYKVLITNRVRLINIYLEAIGTTTQTGKPFRLTFTYDRAFTPRSYMITNSNGHCVVRGGGLKALTVADTYLEALQNTHDALLRQGTAKELNFFTQNKGTLIATSNAFPWAPLRG